MAVGRKEYVQRRQRQSQQIRRGRFRRRTPNNNGSVDARQKIRKHFIVKSESGIDNNQRVQIYTTHFDARNKINAKKGVFPQTNKFTSSRSSGVATKALEDIQKGPLKPNTNINGNMKRSKQALGTKNKPAIKRPSNNYNPTGVRESTFTGKSIKISTMNDLAPKERKTLVKGKSLSIVAKNKAGRANNKQLLHKTINNTWVGPSMSRLPSSSPEPSATTSKKSSMPAKVVISNLHPNVTQEDILELFGAIGSLRDGRLKSVGSAEVIYRVAEDAFAAYSKYHGRNLDGQPMILKITTAEEGGSSRMMSSRSSRYDSMPSLPPCYSAPVLSSNNGPSTPGAPVVFTVKL